MIRKLILVAAVLFLLPAANAMAVDFGINGDWSKTEHAHSGDWGLGARLDFGGNFRGQVTFDYFFVNADDLFDEDDLTSSDLDLKFWEANGNVAYQFPSESVHPYVGGGVGVARRSFSHFDLFDNQTQLGLNILGGVKFGHGVQPFIELRGTFYPDDDAVLPFGDRFIFAGGILF